MLDEGYIKFDLRHEEKALPEGEVPESLVMWRNRLRELDLIGIYASEGIGYGNVSVRSGEGFVISGSATGGIKAADASHFAKVRKWSIDLNQVVSEGQVPASSESLTHAMFYECDPAIGAVIHVHSRKYWTAWQGQLPTSDSEVPYGTPEMAREVRRLFSESSLPQTKILVMGGHEEGIISFGSTLEEAGEILFSQMSVPDPGPDG